MSYGILVENSDNRVILDETYPHIYPRISFSRSGYDSYPGSTQYQAGDLVLVTCNSSGYVGIGNTSGGSATYLSVSAYPTLPTYSANHTPPTSGYTVVLGSKMAGNLTPANSGYGTEIYNSSSQLVYTTAPYQFFKVIGTGTVSTPQNQQIPVEIAFPSLDGEFENLKNIFVLANNTAHLFVVNPYFGYDGLIGYRYEYTSGNKGRVYVTVRSFSNSGIGGINFNYLIVEKI